MNDQGTEVVIGRIEEPNLPSYYAAGGNSLRQRAASDPVLLAPMLLRHHLGLSAQLWTCQERICNFQAQNDPDLS